MNQEKTGEFIKELRIEKGMTQEDLADKMYVSRKAVSKWESGRAVPSLSMMQLLCKEFGISIEELLNGGKLENTHSKRESSNPKKKTKVYIVLGVLLVLVLLTLFGVDLYRMKNSKPVLFSTWGFKYAPPINIDEKRIEIAIKDYLVSIGDKECTIDGEKAFVSMRIYEIDEEKNFYNVYAWVLEEKYYLFNNEITEAAGSSIPYKFVVEKQDDEFVVLSSQMPRDGSYYGEDMDSMFPRSVRNAMDKIYDDGTVEVLQLEIDEQTKLYFSNVK